MPLLWKELPWLNALFVAGLVRTNAEGLVQLRFKILNRMLCGYVGTLIMWFYGNLTGDRRIQIERGNLPLSHWSIGFFVKTCGSHQETAAVSSFMSADAFERFGGMLVSGSSTSIRPRRSALTTACVLFTASSLRLTDSI